MHFIELGFWIGAGAAVAYAVFMFLSIVLGALIKGTAAYIVKKAGKKDYKSDYAESVNVKQEDMKVE